MARMDSIVKYVRKSSARLEVLKALGRTITTPNKVAARTHIQLATVQSTINDLIRKGLVEKAVNKTTRPMIYKTTKLGDAVLRMKDASGNIRWKGSSKQKRIARRIFIF